MDGKLAGQLEEIVGPEAFTRDTSDLLCYSYDASGRQSVPEAVVFPRSAGEVSRILKVAAVHRLPVFPRGAATGTTGASVPVKGGLVLSLERMNRILCIDAGDLQAQVEPGVVTGELQRKVSEYGLFYPPDPASLNFCTLGGNVSTGAGGARAVKYGVTRDYIMALEVVLPGGEIIRTGTRSAKGVVGYDLTRLMVGSEGTLGVVTGITLRLVPAPRGVGAMLAFFRDSASASAAVAGFFRAGILPRCAEYLDRLSLECIRDRLPVSVPAGIEAMLLVEVDGAEESIEGQLASVCEACRMNGAYKLHTGESDEQRESFWAARRSLSPSIKKLGFSAKINEDICVPRQSLPEMMASLDLIAAETHVTILSFGHAGDGNLHVNILYNKETSGAGEMAEKAVKKVMKAALSLDGTISGEHGIGLTKRPFINMEIHEREMELMKSIKRVFDPDNILNPGKIF
ncbi:MAG TPA: FAD-binding protein [Thermodesulfobacteriaceae bacterium]|nr:FAD-binding protein [Thermodesulfobacteriaceae bacterium]